MEFFPFLITSDFTSSVVLSTAIPNIPRPLSHLSYQFPSRFASCSSFLSTSRPPSYPTFLPTSLPSFLPSPNPASHVPSIPLPILLPISSPSTPFSFPFPNPFPFSSPILYHSRLISLSILLIIFFPFALSTSFLEWFFLTSGQHVTILVIK